VKWPFPEDAGASLHREDASAAKRECQFYAMVSIAAILAKQQIDEIEMRLQCEK
jgi:hypothetical protein